MGWVIDFVSKLLIWELTPLLCFLTSVILCYTWPGIILYLLTVSSTNGGVVMGTSGLTNIHEHCNKPSLAWIVSGPLQP